jgi:hypothetical protein
MLFPFIVLATSMSFSFSAQAAPVFSDNFDSETSNASNYAGFANFQVTGYVDVIGAGNPDGILVSSNVVDLAGQSGPGTLTSKASFLFNSGDTVRLSYDAGSAQRGSMNNFFSRLNFSSSTSLINFGTGLSGFNDIVWFPSIKLPYFTVWSGFSDNAPFLTHSIFFTAGSAGSLTFSIGTRNAEPFGPLIDNVKLDITPNAVPEASTWAMMIAGFGTIGMALRRRRTAVRATFA